jgi:hypothetical protein
MCDACSLVLFETGVVVSIQQCEITDQRGASVVVQDCCVMVEKCGAGVRE